MRLAVRLLVLAAALFLLRLVVPLGVAWAHYSTTPTFREWAVERPADDAVWEAVALEGEARGEGPTWTWPEGTDDFAHAGEWRATLVVAHGEDALLDAEVLVTYAFEELDVDEAPEDEWVHPSLEGVQVELARAEVDPGFRAVLVVTLRPMVRGERAPKATLDAFVLAGPGETRLLVRETDAPGPGMGASLLGEGALMEGYSTTRVVLGLVHPPGDAPEEGLAYQARARFHPSWARKDTGSASGGFGPWEFAGTSAQYSVRFEAAGADRAPWQEGDGYHKTSSELDRAYTMNGEVW